MKIFWIASCIGMAVLLSPPTRANTYNEKTIFTFSAPVEMPGRVLEPGTYVFTLLDSISDRDIVQVWNQDQTKLLGTFPAIPDERLKAAGKPVITFEERLTGSLKPAPQPREVPRTGSIQMGGPLAGSPSPSLRLFSESGRI
jgi:hypothetical protein